MFGPGLLEKYCPVAVMYNVRNHHDPFAVMVCKETTVVGHVPRKISAVCYVFLGKTGATITGTVTGLN